MESLGLECTHPPSPFQIKLADSTRVKALGSIPNLMVDIFGVEVFANFHVILSKFDGMAYPIILGEK